MIFSDNIKLARPDRYKIIRTLVLNFVLFNGPDVGGVKHLGMMQHS